MAGFWQISVKIKSMVNYMQVSYRLHTAGSPTLQDLRDLRAAGVEVVINLASDASLDSLPDEPTQVAALGMDYHHIPVAWEAPTRRNMEVFFDVLEAHRERVLFVHCVMNMRVSAFIFLYRVLRLGWAEENARRDMLKIWEPNSTWSDFIAKMLLLIS
jgi:protein tyrosine phosphatase (PTP) superfamily phosphohydrolase (DUF442 family)